MDPSLWPEGICIHYPFFPPEENKNRNHVNTETSTNPKLSVCHQNIQSLRNKTLEIQKFLCTLDEKPSLLCFTEHWMSESEVLTRCIQDYRLITSFSRPSQQHRGSCIFARNNLNFEPFADQIQMSIEGHIECYATYSGKYKYKYIITVYSIYCIYIYCI